MITGCSRRPVRFIGVPTDVNSSFTRGPAKAPSHIRAALFSDRGNPAAENGLELGKEIHLHDAGDLPIAEAADDDSLIEAAVTEAAMAGELPICVGGDHSITFPAVAALARFYGPLNILHFDAHPDLYDEFLGNKRSHASPFARILEQGASKRLVQVGIRTLNEDQARQARRWSVEMISARSYEDSLVPIFGEPLYISIDLDGIDPSEAPGVSHPEPGGLTVREVLRALDRQTARIIGADVVELNPRRDVNDVTAILAAKLIKEICSLPGAK